MQNAKEKTSWPAHDLRALATFNRVSWSVKHNEHLPAIEALLERLPQQHDLPAHERASVCGTRKTDGTRAMGSAGPDRQHDRRIPASNRSQQFIVDENDLVYGSRDPRIGVAVQARRATATHARMGTGTRRKPFRVVVSPIISPGKEVLALLLATQQHQCGNSHVYGVPGYHWSVLPHPLALQSCAQLLSGL